MRWLAGCLALVVTQGCGDGIVPPDATVPLDGGGGLVRVRFVSGTQVAGHPVYFQRADSSLVHATRTDAEGRANAFMPADGGFVTVVAGVGGFVPIYTYAGVAPGDDLVIDDRTASQDVRELRLSVVPDPTAQFYQLETGCGLFDATDAVVQPISIPLFGCGDVSDMLLFALDGGTPRYQFRDHVLLGGTTQLSFTGAFQPVEATTVAVVNVPPAISSLTVTHGLASGQQVLQARGWFEDTTGGGAAETVEVPAPATATSVTTLDPSIAAHHVIEWRPATTEVTIDYDAPRQRAQLEPARYQPTSSAITWTEELEGAVPTLTVGTMQWAGEREEFYQWFVVAPRGEQPIVRLPVLPRPELDPSRSQTMVFPVLASVVLSGDATAVRTRLLGRWEPNVAWPTEGAAGRVVWRGLTATTN